ncbi:MAG TPA: ferritin-like domain-containing protein [Myxococcota bacterium]|nr:ferritin-like domain-containing protein [Myxococcota bacterium]
MTQPLEVHQLAPEAFFEEVHRFAFWFDSVSGYLDGLQHGRSPQTPEAVLSPLERDRLVTVLCNYCIGETAALEGAGGLIQIAPNRQAKVLLSTQTLDEGRHLEVLTQRLRELGVADTEAEIARRGSRSLQEFHRRLLELVRGRDWVAALFAQNVVLECMEFAVFALHAKTADPRTREVLAGIVKDERRHMGFGENELGRRLREAPYARERLRAVRFELDALVLSSFEETFDAIGTPRSERAQPGHHYLDAVARLGFA